MGTNLPKIFKELPPHPDHHSATYMAGEGFEIAFAFYEAGTVVETHRHDTANYGVITRGEMKLTKEGVEKAMDRVDGMKFQLDVITHLASK